MNKLSSTLFYVLTLCCLLFTTLGKAATLFVESQVGDPGCDLVDAINSANNNASEGGCFALGSYVDGGIDNIELLIDDIVLEDAAATFSGTPIVRSKIHIIGPNQKSLTTIARSEEIETPNFRLFTVSSSGGDLILENIEIVNGNVGEAPEGGFYIGNAISVSGQATLRNVTVRDSGGEAERGADTVNVRSSGSLTVERSSFYNNHSSGGGAIGTSSDTIITIYDSTFSDNSGTISGAISINSRTSNVSIFNSTIVNNTGQNSGGLYFNSGLTSAEIEKSLIVRNSIISGNTGSFGPDEVNITSIGATNGFVEVTFDNNIVGIETISTSDAVSNLTPLVDNIFTTSDSDLPMALNEIVGSLKESNKKLAYYPLADNSPAIDTAIPFRVFGGGPPLFLFFYEPGCTGKTIEINAPAPYRTDQLGTERPIGSECDIGAIEYIPQTEQCYVVPTLNDKTVVFCL